MMGSVSVLDETYFSQNPVLSLGPHVCEAPAAAIDVSVVAEAACTTSDGEAKASILESGIGPGLAMGSLVSSPAKPGRPRADGMIVESGKGVSSVFSSCKLLR